MSRVPWGMVRSTLDNKKLSNGFMSFEYLDCIADEITPLLKKYTLNISRDNRQWVAVLSLPQTIDESPKEKSKSGIFRIFSRKSNFERLDPDFKSGLSKICGDMLLRSDIESGRVEGFFCGFSGDYVQDCIEQLALNVVSNEYFGEYTSFPLNIAGSCSPWSTDTLGTYLYKGNLKGIFEDGMVVLTATHPNLPEFLTNGASLREAYHDLVGKIKRDLTIEDLWPFK